MIADATTVKTRMTLTGKPKLPEDTDTTPKKKRRTKLDQLDKVITKETRTRRRHVEESPTSPNKGKSKLEKEEKGDTEKTKEQPKDIPPRRKSLAKKKGKQHSPP